MLTARAGAVLAGGALLWIGSRFVGSAEVHIVAVGLVALVPLAMALLRWLPRELRATRRLSTPRAMPGTRVRIDVDLENPAGVRTSFVLVEDRLPPALGPPARAVVGSLPSGGRERFSYQVTCRARGRYAIGPLRASISDPFGLVRRRIRFDDVHELVVYPEVEKLGAGRVPAPPGGAGESTSRQLFRTGEDFYTMRAYEVGDDLRRIHWPSVAKTGDLMIRQEEAARRALVGIFVDTRRTGLGATADAFERGISAAASVGELYLRSGYGLRLATSETPPRAMPRAAFLEALAVAEPTPGALLSPSLDQLRSIAGGGGTLVAITHVPNAEEIATLLRVGPAFAKPTAILVHRSDRATLPPKERSAMAERAESARIALGRGGWEVIVIEPSERLAGRWARRQGREVRAAASW